MSVREYLNVLKENKFASPVEATLLIISEACKRLLDIHKSQGHPITDDLKIIHRNFIPSNIFLTYKGEVRLTGFSITQNYPYPMSPDEGHLKGAINYFAPEYLDGLPLDQRYDQFQLGIVLWEMLCLRTLFKSDNDIGILQKIRNCDIPIPSTINPAVPKELDRIVLKALSRNPNDRYNDLENMYMDLIKLLSTFEIYHPSEIGYFLIELAKLKKKNHLANLSSEVIPPKKKW